MIFRQLFDSKSSTYTYVLADETTREAVIIDPVYEQATRDTALIRELDLNLLFALDTHCHADHVTGAWLLRQKTGCQIGSSAAIGAANVDLDLKQGDKVGFGRHSLEVRATPGHTDGCLSFVTDDQGMAFTGDALLIRGCGRCDFQQGDAETLFESIQQQVFSLPDECLVYPAHDYNGRTASSVGEEKRFNARLGGGANMVDFVGYMNAMQLPHPKQIDVALPANMDSGKPMDGVLPAEPDWAPANTTFAGVLEVEPGWVAEHKQDLTILDVREPEECIPGESSVTDALHIPLGELRKRLEELPMHAPVVAFCRSGRRSAMAVAILNQAGFERVANLSGGLLRWRDEGLADV